MNSGIYLYVIQMVWQVVLLRTTDDISRAALSVIVHIVGIFRPRGLESILVVSFVFRQHTHTHSACLSLIMWNACAHHMAQVLNVAEIYDFPYRWKAHSFLSNIQRSTYTKRRMYCMCETHPVPAQSFVEKNKTILKINKRQRVVQTQSRSRSPRVHLLLCFALDFIYEILFAFVVAVHASPREYFGRNTIPFSVKAFFAHPRFCVFSFGMSWPTSTNRGAQTARTKKKRVKRFMDDQRFDPREHW